MFKKHLLNSLLIIFKSLIYSAGQLLLGLILHPYRSVQILVKNKIFLPFIFYPSLFFVSFFILLRVNLITNLYQQFLVFKLFYQTGLVFCFYWQIALFYLWLRFTRAFAKQP